MHFHIFIWIVEHPLRGDNANEQNIPSIRMDDSIVMLSEAKHLAAPGDRPFAEFTLSGSEGLRVTVEGPISTSVVFFESP